jgi:hypothetical protein
VKNSRYRSFIFGQTEAGSHEFKNAEISNLKDLTMASKDSNSGSETESDRSFAALDFIAIVAEAETRQISHWESVQKKQKTETKPRAVFPAKLHTIVMKDKHISKLLHGQDYNHNASLRVIGVALCMQKDHLQKLQRVGKEKAKYVEKPRIRDTVCNLFHHWS